MSTADPVRLAVQERASSEQHGRHDQPAVGLAARQVSRRFQHPELHVVRERQPARFQRVGVVRQPRLGLRGRAAVLQEERGLSQVRFRHI